MLKILTEWVDKIEKWVGYWNALPPSKKLPAYLVVFNIVVFFALVVKDGNVNEEKDGKFSRCEERYNNLSLKYNECEEENKALNKDFVEYLKDEKQIKSKLVDTLKSR